jgi:hypothetical protein
MKEWVINAARRLIRLILHENLQTEVNPALASESITLGIQLFSNDKNYFGTSENPKGKTNNFW